METSGLGKLIRDARLRRGWTQEDLADRLGVKDSYVSQWETGARKWPQEFIRNLSELLGLRQVDMAVAAGLIDPPGDLASAPVVDFRLKEIVEGWPRLRDDVQRDLHGIARTFLANPRFRVDGDDEPVVAVSR